MDDERLRVEKLILYFQELLDKAPDNSDPESDEAIERRLLQARITNFERWGREWGSPEFPSPVRLMSSSVIALRLRANPALLGHPKRPTIRIVVIDDRQFARRGIADILESQPDFKVAGEVRNGDSAIEMIRQHKPDVVIMNLKTPVPEGLAAIRAIVPEVYGRRVVVHTMHCPKPLADEILRIGARGYVMEPDLRQNLIDAVVVVLFSGLYVTHNYQEFLIGDPPPQPQPSVQIPLTKREIEIIALLARGKSDREAATELNISLLTAETHRANIMNKLQLHSIQDLVRYAVENKLIEI
jgi:DNA-binding NarL/FixJ family response regulator